MNWRSLTKGGKMSETRTALLNAARQGDSAAIAELIHQALSADITATVTTEDTPWQVVLQGPALPDEEHTKQLLRQLFEELGETEPIAVQISAHRETAPSAGWQTTLRFPAESDGSDSTPLESLSTAPPSSRTRLPNLKSVVGAVGHAASTVGSAAVQGGSVVSEAIADTARTLGETALHTGSAIGQTSATALNTVGQKAMSVPQGLGILMNAVNERPELKGLSKVLKMGWLLDIVDTVDVVKAEQQVRQLQAKHPQDTPAQISRRIMAQKALYVSGSGLASSLVPGFAAAMVAVDLAATTAVQAEMGYQIACAYGFDVKDEDRKGEILAIFGLALGSNQALKTGFTYLARGIPIAGAAIGASANAVALYAVGHAATQYYEAKRQAPDAAVEIDRIAQQQSIRQAAAQQMIMDQILTHIVVAGYPNHLWDDLESDLEGLNLSPATLQIIQQEIKNPAPLDQLLDQLDEEFAVFLLAQCQRIAELDGVVNEEEATILETIAAKLAERQDDTAEDKRSIAQNIRQKLFGWRQRSAQQS